MNRYQHAQQVWRKQQRFRLALGISSCILAFAGMVVLTLWFMGCTHVMLRAGDVTYSRSSLIHDHDVSAGISSGTLSAWFDVSTRGDSAVQVMDDLTTTAVVTGEAYLRAQGAP